MRSLFLASALVALGALTACANTTKPAPSTQTRAENPDSNGWVYMVRLSRPDLFDTITPAEQALFSEHFAYLQNLTRQGKVIVAGPCTDDPPLGLVIFEAPDESAAREIMLGDPAVKGGVFHAELHPMRISLLRERDAHQP